MRAPRSLQARLGLGIGLLLAVLWIAAASLTAVVLRREMDEVFDSALAETAQRLMPLAVLDIVGREETGITQRLGAIRDHDELFTYVVRDPAGRILLQSHAADPADFPPFEDRGFSQTATHRLYSESALSDSIRLTVAEPLAHRASVARELQMGLGLPLFLVTMASQNLPGFATLRAAGYEPPVGPALRVTGGLSVVSALFGAHPVSMAAITAAICLGPDVHPDPARRWRVGLAVAGLDRTAGAWRGKFL
ncbi:MAG: benzoate/H(+) symporter BenE family transporter [Rhodobacterales bacterium]|nr:benzoate/H(+) symporter BenE family transporter [Rhodobacterales bacterium]